MINHQFTIQFTEEHIRYACGKFYVRFIWVVFPAICLLVTGFGIIGVVSEKLGALSGAFLALGLGGLGIIFGAYFQGRKYALSQFQKTGNKVNYELSDEFFKAKSGMGSVELKWDSFKALWIFQNLWLLVFDKSGYLTLPTDQLSTELKEFLKQRIISMGGKIK